MLFTSPTCHKCPEAKAFLDSNGIEYTVMEVGVTPKALELAREHSIMNVPAILIGEQVIPFEDFKGSFQS